MTANSTGMAIYSVTNSTRNGSTVVSSSGRYASPPHSAPIANVNTNPSTFSERHALNHAIVKIARSSNA